MLIKLVTLILLASSCGQVKAEGVDFTPAALGCIMSGGTCFSHTGVKFVDDLFTKDVDMSHYNTYEYREYYYNSHAYWGNCNVGDVAFKYCQFPGPRECRKAKELFYLKQSKFKFDDTKSGNEGWQEQEHMEQYKQRKGSDIFECTSAQRKIFAKAKIGKK